MTTSKLPASAAGRGARADALYARLRDAIVSGALAPGERLVEDALATSEGVSRTPVREALQRLEADGFVRMSNRGLIVVDFSTEELADLCRVRIELEALACRLAAASRSEEHLAALDHIVSETARVTPSDDATLLVELNHAFHGTIAHAARNTYLESQLRHLRSLIERLQTTTLRDRERQIEALQDHREIVEAIRARDEQAAADGGRAHFEKATLIRLHNKRSQELRAG